MPGLSVPAHHLSYTGGGYPDPARSFWTHLPGIDLDPKRLAEKTYEFFRTYDVDFIKTMNNGMYAIEDFGCEIDYSEISKGGVAKVTKTPIHRPEDWYQLKCCSTESGSLAREREGLQLLVDKVKGEEVPVIFTIFSPLTIANKLSANTLRDHINEGHKEAVHAALKVITETTCNMEKRVLELGADGIFLQLRAVPTALCLRKNIRSSGFPMIWRCWKQQREDG